MNEKQVMILSIAVLAAVLLIGGGFIYYFQFVELAGQKAELEKVTSDLAKAQEKVSQIKKLEDEVKKLAEEEKQKIQKIPNLDRTEYDDFANLLDEQRKRAGVFITKTEWKLPQKASAGGGRGAAAAKKLPEKIHKIQYDMQVSGGFYQLLKFINLLEQLTRFVNVDSLTIAPASGSSKDPSAALRRDLKVSLVSYTYKVPDALPPAPKEEKPMGKTTPIPD